MTAPSVWLRAFEAVTPLGDTWAATAAALAAGKSAVAPIAAFDCAGFPSTVACEIAAPWAKVADRRRAIALHAAERAWQAAALTAAPERIGVFVGAESGRAEFATVRALALAAGSGPAFDHGAFARFAPALAARFDAGVASPAAVAASIAGRVGALGPCETFSLACASSSAAIVEAVRALRGGECDVAVCGGVGADVDPLMLTGFGLLGMLSSRGASCPFDIRRDGMVVGEGAAFFVLAIERGPAMVEMAGVGRSLDAGHLTAPDPQGAGAVRAMRAALADAGEVSVDCVQAHGTSTPLNDGIEIAALRQVLGEAAEQAYVSSVKGALGHWIAGAGAIGLCCAVHAVVAAEVLPTAGLRDVAPECKARHVVGTAVRAPIRTALANAFAFGGANSCVVVRSAA